MELKREFLAALRGGEGHDALLKLVHRHQAQGLALQEAYEILHQLWLEFGFDKIEECSDLRDNLEYVMEKVWYGSPA
jgi:hypothetical protein